MKKVTVSIQGLPGSFHDVAAKKHFGGAINLVFRKDFSEVFADIERKACDYGVVAYDNSRYGPIYEVEDLIKEFKPKIKDEIKLQVSFCLLGLKDSSLGKIKEVFSQKPALIQCRNFLEDEIEGVKSIEHFDTAGAAADVSRWGDPTKAALASELCADIYDLKILARSCEDAVGDNDTCFYVIEAS